MHGIAHGEALEPIRVDVLEKGMDERLVGAAQARRDAGLSQLRLGRAPRRLVLEQPGLQTGAAMLARAPIAQKDVKRAWNALVEQGRHFEVCPVGSR